MTFVDVAGLRWMTMEEFDRYIAELGPVPYGPLPPPDGREWRSDYEEVE